MRKSSRPSTALCTLIDVDGIVPVRAGMRSFFPCELGKYTWECHFHDAVRKMRVVGSASQRYKVQALHRCLAGMAKGV